MTDKIAFRTHFTSMARDIRAVNRANGFDPTANVPQSLCLIHSEVSEALEVHRKDPHAMDEKIPQHEAMSVELADAVIRCMDLAEALDLDLAGAIVAKVAYNATRPHKHGKRY